MKPWQLFDVCFFKTNNISSLKHLLCGRLIWVVGSFPRKIGWQDKFSQVESKAAGTSVNKRSQKQLWIIQRPSASTQCNFDVYNHRVFNNPLRLLLSFCCCWLTDCSFPLRSISSSSSLLSLPTTVGCPPTTLSSPAAAAMPLSSSVSLLLLGLLLYHNIQSLLLLLPANALVFPSILVSSSSPFVVWTRCAGVTAVTQWLSGWSIIQMWCVCLPTTRAIDSVFGPLAAAFTWITNAIIWACYLLSPPIWFGQQDGINKRFNSVCKTIKKRNKWKNKHWRARLAETRFVGRTNPTVVSKTRRSESERPLFKWSKSTDNTCRKH